MNEDLDRLLRAVARRKEDAPAEMPFGFDTRVIAQWRAHADTASIGLTRLLRRVAYTAAAVIILAAAGAYIETERDGDADEPFTNELAIADATIQEAAGL
ncbi:MAG: hypothetical protein ABR514_06940 [Chthoniobacterales bacterium]